MSRIPESEITRIKQSVDLVALVQSKGIALKKHTSNDYIGLCPFHDDKNNPNFIVTPSKGLFHCMRCEAAGNTIQFLERYEGISFRHAFEILAEGNLSTLMKSSSGPVKKASTPKLSSPVEFTADDQKAFKQVLDYYHERLFKNPSALKYVARRGLSEATLKAFKVGFCDRTLGLRLPESNRQAGAEIRGRLKRLGIYRDNGREHFRGRVVFPVMNEQGHVVQVYGRMIASCDKSQRHYYLPGPRQGIFNFSCLSSRELILCDSIIDALTFWEHGFKNVTCVFGDNGLTDEMESAFVKHKVTKLYFAYDRDEPGQEAVLKHSTRLSSLGIDCYNVKFPQGMDANAYAFKVTPGSKSLKVLLQSAQWIEHSKNKSDKSTLSTKLAANLAAKAKPVAEEATKEKKENVELEFGYERSECADSALPKSDLSFTTAGEDYIFTLGDRQYRVRGLHKNTSFEVLKINLRLFCNELFFVNVLDLYQAKQRSAFINEAAAETTLKPELIKRDLGKLMLKLEQLQEERINGALKAPEPEVTLEQSERDAALALLKDPQLLERILNDFNRCGIVGEATNKLTGYLACVSRKLDRPLAVIVQSTSAAGKSALMEAVLSFLPSEEKVKYSAMTGQSLYYLGETELKHRVLAIVEEEGAEKASYALKLLQSEGELTIASTGKDELGRMKTEEYHVEGPVMIFLTTTAIDIDEELMNRCVVLTVDEGREQTQAIHAKQREARTFEGLKRKHASAEILNVHRNAQRLLKTLNVINPYANALTFRSDRTRTRRDHMKYLTLIDTITLLHQYQRPLKERDDLQYIEVTLDDIEAANALSHEVLGRSLDELPPQTRRFLIMLQHMADEACKSKQMQPSDYRFTQRQIREYSGWSSFQVSKHLSRLLELEYVLCYRGRGQGRFEYELIYDGDGNSDAHLIGLIDIEGLKKWGYDSSCEPLEQESEPPVSPALAPDLPSVCSAQNKARSCENRPQTKSGNEAA